MASYMAWTTDEAMGKVHPKTVASWSCSAERMPTVAVPYVKNEACVRRMLKVIGPSPSTVQSSVFMAR